MLCRSLLYATLTVISLAPMAIAQISPDSNGDYFRNDAPTRAARSVQTSAAGSLWQVVSVGLNCRNAPGAQQQIIRQFRQGEILQVEVGRGGSDEVLSNPTDANGKPWMPVRVAGLEQTCYVRANYRYIHPFSP